MRLRINMKPQGVRIVFIFGVLLVFAATASSLCYVKRTPTSRIFLYQCFMSDDCLADMNKAPVDMQRVIFTNSKIPLVKNSFFSRLSNSLEKVAVYYSNVEEIEDDAFKGLKKLDLLAFPGNKLRVIKSAWFEGLDNIKCVSFQNNHIKHIDDNLFSLLPPLEILDISVNQIKCLPTALFGNFKVNDFEFRHNHLKPICEAELIYWMKDNNIEFDHFDNNYLDTQYILTKICSDKLSKSQMNEETINQCINRTTRDLLPAKGNYTVKKMCQLFKNTPSPFLNCREVMRA